MFKPEPKIDEMDLDLPDSRLLLWVAHSSFFSIVLTLNKDAE